jgi:hypothetical protein
VRKADTYHLHVPMSRNLGALTSWNPLGLFRPVMEQLYLYLYLYLICPASFLEYCKWLTFPLNGLRVLSRVSPVVGLLPLASGPACAKRNWTMLFVCLFSWRYNPLWLYFHSPVAGFSLLMFEVSRSNTTTRHGR